MSKTSLIILFIVAAIIGVVVIASMMTGGMMDGMGGLWGRGGMMCPT